MGNYQDQWSEELSRRYIDYGRYFVPQRELQMRIMVDLLRALPRPCTILELCCGEGLLAKMILEQLPGASYIGMDGSKVMLDRAKETLSGFPGHYQLRSFKLEKHNWRSLEQPVASVVSSLAIHHLDGKGKRELFKDVFNMVRPGGIFIIADMIEPASQAGRNLAADLWDEVVQQRSVELDGNPAAPDFFTAEKWNTYRYDDPDDIDHPSRLYDQLCWLNVIGFEDIDVHFFQAGHALFSGWKSRV